MSAVKKTKVAVIPNDAVTTINISGQFYGRIAGVYFNLVSKYSKEELTKLLKAVNDDKTRELPTEQEQLDAQSLETLLILTRGIEMAFEKSDKITQEEVEVPTEG